MGPEGQEKDERCQVGEVEEHRDLKDRLIIVRATFASSISSASMRTLHRYPWLSVWGEEQGRD